MDTYKARRKRYFDQSLNAMGKRIAAGDPTVRHGTSFVYQAGCRCKTCREYWNDQARRWRRRRYEETVRR